MNGYNIDFTQMSNWKPEGIQSTPSFTFGQEGMDRAIDSLGNIFGVYTRKDMLSKDPELEALKEQLDRLMSRKAKLNDEIATINASIYDEDDKGMLADRAYEQASNLDPSKKMEGYRPSDSSLLSSLLATEQMRGYDETPEGWRNIEREDYINGQPWNMEGYKPNYKPNMNGYHPSEVNYVNPNTYKGYNVFG